MNIAHIEEHSRIYGPGIRYVIWVQGCSIHCKGCWNKEMWSFGPKFQITIPALIHNISQKLAGIEGITLLGGEPLDQWEEVQQLLEAVKNLNISIMIFTGYETHEIPEANMQFLSNFCDILITGRYDDTKRTINHQWIGSTNQQIHFLTKRYNDFEITNANYIEISIDDYGKIATLGFPDEDFWGK